MRPNALCTPRAPTSLRSELADYLRVSGSHLSMAQAAGLAVRAWIAADRAAQPAAHGPSQGPSHRPSHGPARGYLWKTLFLPHGTQLRMVHGKQTYLAEVIGDAMMFGDVSVSPRGMTLAVAGCGRNAWRDLMLKLPAERYWKRASQLRLEASPASGGQSAAAPAALSSAALALADAFTAALALGAGAPGLRAPLGAALHPQAPAGLPERRSAQHRRNADMLDACCQFD